MSLLELAIKAATLVAEAWQVPMVLATTQVKIWGSNPEFLYVSRTSMGNLRVTDTKHPMSVEVSVADLKEGK